MEIVRLFLVFFFCYLITLGVGFYLWCCVLFSWLLKQGHHPGNASHISLAWTFGFPAIVSCIVVWWISRDIYWLLILAGVVFIALIIFLSITKKSAAYK